MSQVELKSIHFVGIGGIGMSGIAEVLFNQGYRVSGSDQKKSENTERLSKMGITIFVGHDKKNVVGARVLVISSAVSNSNTEVIEARKLRIPVIPRAEMLGELMRNKTGIAVAGSHGKTSTTSMLAAILTQANLDPTVIIGGIVGAWGTNARLGKGKFVVAEADESDGSFLHLPTTYGVVTNIDNDHLDFFGNQNKIDDSFISFVGKLPFYGMAAVCAEDEGVRRCLERFTKPIITYGFSDEWGFSAKNIETSRLGSGFDVMVREDPRAPATSLGRVTLAIPGRHNILNALATVVIATKLGISFETISSGLNQYKGVRRRFELVWSNSSGSRAIIDDYGHHPTEIRATLAAAKEYWPGRIISVFQPHRYTRTFHCQTEFPQAFVDADQVVVTDIFGAGENPIAGVTSENLVKKLKETASSKQGVFHVSTLEEAGKKVVSLFQDGDLVLCMGAGSITGLPLKIIDLIHSKK